MTALSALTALRSLALPRLRFMRAGASALGLGLTGMPALTSLNLSRTLVPLSRSTSIIDMAIGLASCTALLVLDLSFNGHDDDSGCVRAIRTIRARLRSLKLDRNPLGGEAISAILLAPCALRLDSTELALCGHLEAGVAVAAAAWADRAAGVAVGRQ